MTRTKFVIDEQTVKVVRALLKLASALSDNESDRDRFGVGLALFENDLQSADTWASKEGLGYCPDCEDRNMEPDRDESHD